MERGLESAMSELMDSGPFPLTTVTLMVAVVVELVLKSKLLPPIVYPVALSRFN